MKFQLHLFESTAVRTVQNSGIWFVAADVCEVLGIANNRDAVACLDEDEKGVSLTDTLGGKQKTTIISESGLYRLIFKSRKPAAQKFRRWVTSEVLPALRQTGRYEVVGSLPKEQDSHEAGVRLGRLQMLLCQGLGKLLWAMTRRPGDVRHIDGGPEMAAMFAALVPEGEGLSMEGLDPDNGSLLRVRRNVSCPRSVDVSWEKRPPGELLAALRAFQVFNNEQKN